MNKDEILSLAGMPPGKTRWQPAATHRLTRVSRKGPARDPITPID
ncbi:hypothetical protein [Roseovarius sp. MBR-6]|jgi:hypothetical protein